LQQYIEKGKRPKLSKAKSGIEWYESKIGLFGNKTFSEVIVFSENLKIAGTVDLLRQLAIQS
jgi:hypothetical protein|tara:strand:- start:335 stop:520 length:186 start_codon:yes stop_codon:yes gene_type:complete